MNRNCFIYALLIFILPMAANAYAKDMIQGDRWLDTDGNPINAHGAGMLYHNGRYYLYGEYKKGRTVLPGWATWECYRTDVTGISCYSSPDLYDWTFEGVVLKSVPEDSSHDLHPSKVLERPKVVYNSKTGKFVMWAHVESADYSKAAAGVAVSDSPTGPFTYLGSFRPNNGMSRDQTLFVDDDGRAYQFCSSENNRTIHINELTEDYLKPTGRFVRRFAGQSREAPAVFKKDGKYYMLSSGCTGWDPNEAELAVADSIMGEWTVLGNPCKGLDADKTFYGQSTYVQPVHGKKDCYIAMFDRWNKTDLEDSRYIWLPVSFVGAEVEIPWSETFTLDRFDEAKRSVRTIPVGEGFCKTSVNAAVFRGSSLVSNDSLQYIAYYDPEGNVMVGKRRLGSDKWILNKTQYTGNVNDAHNVISLGLDGAGILHLSFDHHGDPLHYCRAIAAGSLEFGELNPMTGQDELDVTYPEFYSLPDGDLLFAYRAGASGRGNFILNRYDCKSRQWKRVHDVIIDGEGERNAYWQMYVDRSGNIYLSWVWRESWLVETNHDICYARSSDGGRTWTRSDGSPYTLPITIDNAETVWHVPQKSELINQTGMTADNEGHPYIATYWRSQGDSVPQYRLVWFNGDRWNMSTVGRRHTPFSLAGGGTKMIPISRPRIASDGKAAYYIFRDAERGSKVSVAYTPMLGIKEWEIADITDYSVDAWEPTFDTNLWNTSQKLHLYVQRVHQGDGERTDDSEQHTTVSVIEY